MSPEQVEGSRKLDGRSDIYALGIMLYYCLVGKPPFDGDTAFAVMMSHARDIAAAIDGSFRHPRRSGPRRDEVP